MLTAVIHGRHSRAIQALIDKMSLEQKVAQLFVVSPESLTGVDTVQYAGDTTYQALQDYQVGGLVITKDNIDSSSQLKTMTEKLQSYSEEISGLPLFIAAAEEGGNDSVLGNNDSLDEYYEDSYSDGDESDDTSDFSSYVHSGAPSMSEVGRKDDSTNAYEAGKAIGTLMSEYGLNLDLAPVADVLSGNSYGMGTRTFGTEAQTVSDMALEVLRGIEEQDVHAAMKYFPGYGAASSNMSGFPLINSSLDELKKKEFLPYINAIEQGLDFVIVGHVSVPNVIGDDTPSSLSEKMISEVLRKALGFKGVVMTDYLNDANIVKNYSASDAAVKAIQAGADLLLEPENFEEAYDGVLKAVKNGKISEDRIDESLYRIFRVKVTMMDGTSDTTESEGSSDY